MENRKTVLLIEDDYEDQLFFTEALGEINNATLYGIAKNGKEALDKLANATILPDIIFTDINMPIMNGIDCLTHIIQNPLTKNIKVIILSSSFEQFETASTLGSIAFIKKTFDIKLLRNKMEQLINIDYVPYFQIADQTCQPLRSVA